jgi:hypothetical protein
MKVRYNPIKNEAYPLITVMVIFFITSIFLFTQISNSILYLIIGFPLMVITVIMGYFVYGIVFSYIELTELRIEYVYKNKRIMTGWNDILEVKKSYPNKRVFMKKRELYEIVVIKITSTKEDILFHYVIGPPIKSIKNINVPYTTDPNLDKGMWLSNKDALSLIGNLKARLPKQIIKIN